MGVGPGLELRTVGPGLELRTAQGGSPAASYHFSALCSCVPEANSFPSMLIKVTTLYNVFSLCLCTRVLWSQRLWGSHLHRPGLSGPWCSINVDPINNNGLTKLQNISSRILEDQMR